MKTIKLIAISLLATFQLQSAFSQSWSLIGNAGTNPNNNFLGTTDNKALKFKTNNGLRMTIKADGKVGIGIASPTEDLHLVGTMQIDRSSIGGNTTPAMVLNGLANNIVTVLKVDGIQKSAYGYDVSTNDFLIATDDVGLRPDFIINRDLGFVGLGTKTPGSRLHMVDGDFEISNGGENFFIRTNSSGQLDFVPNTNASAAFLTIDDGSGNVGIGNSSPANKLDVQGGANFFGNIGVQTAANTRTIQCGLTQGALLGIGTVEYIQDGGTSLLTTNNNWAPTSDIGWSLGTSSFRWFDVWAQDGTINTSDLRDKTNVRDINYGINEIMKLRPVSYQWKNDQSYTKLGVIAQEIKEVLPEVVRDWEYQVDEATGSKTKIASARLGVSYDDIIPVLIKGMQDQQAVIEDLKTTISSLQSEVEMIKEGQSSGNLKNNQSKIQSSDLKLETVSLEQNIPNPANQTTTIRFNIPSKSTDAQLIITDQKGITIQQFNHLTAGQAPLEISLANFSSGTYQYTLYVDGKKVDSKQMIISK